MKIDQFTAVNLMRTNLEGLDSVIRMELRGGNRRFLDWDRMPAQRRCFYGRSARYHDLWSGIGLLAGVAIITHGGRIEFEAYGRSCNLDEFQLCARRIVADGKIDLRGLQAWTARAASTPYPRSLTPIRERRIGAARIAHLIAEHRPEFRIWEPGPPEVKLRAEADGGRLGGIFEGGVF